MSDEVETDTRFPPNFLAVVLWVVSGLSIFTVFAVAAGEWRLMIAVAIFIFCGAAIVLLNTQGIIVSDYGIVWYYVRPCWRTRTLTWDEIADIEFGSRFRPRSIYLKPDRGGRIEIMHNSVRGSDELWQTLADRWARVDFQNHP